MRKRTIAGGVLGICLISSFIGGDKKDVESIEISIPDYQEEYDIHTDIPVTITISPEDADTDDLSYKTNSYRVKFSEDGVNTGGYEGSYEIYIAAGDIQSNVLSINVVDVAAHTEAEQLRLEEEQRLAEEKAAQEAEEKRLAEEKAAQEAEKKSLAEEKAAQASEQPAAAAPSSDMVWIDDTAKRYHRKNGCGMDNAYQVTLEEAIARGKTPCGRCY